MSDSTGWITDGQGRRFRVTRLGPGVYVDEQNAMHLVLDELLEASGFQDTPANREMLTQTACEMFSRLGVAVDESDAR